METPTIHEEEMEDYEDEAGSVVESQGPASSSSSGPPNRTIRPATTVRNRLGRPTLVCQECKRLKLKCNRRTPCDKCIEKKRDCKYDPGALTKVDVQSVHNTQIRHQFLLEAITHFLGIPEDEVQMIMNAPTYPPSPGFPGPTVDVKRLRAALGIEGTSGSGGGESLAPRQQLSPNDLLAFASSSSMGSSRNAALLPPAIVTFSRPPPQIPNPSANIFNGSGSLATTTRRNQIPSVMVDLATRVFQANSIVVSHHVLAHLQVWQRVLGWEPRSANEGSIPAASIKPAPAPPTPAAAMEEDEEDGEPAEGSSSASSRAKAKRADTHAVLLTAPPSEIEYHNAARPKDLSVLALVHEAFIMPAIAAQQQASGNTNATPSYVPYSFSSLGLGTSPAPGSASQTAPAFNGGFGGMPHVTSPRSSVSPPPTGTSALPLITPQVVLRYLPNKAWRTAFMHEFDTLMINHDGIGISGRHSVLKKRIELMFDWAEGSMKRMGSNEAGQDSGSTFSSSSSLSSRGGGARRSSSIPSGRGRGRGDGKEPRPLPPPPGVALFAVACAVYALGALSYASKSIHGTFPEEEDEDAEANEHGTGSVAGSSATAIPPGEMPPPAFVPGFGGAGQATSPTNPPMTSLHPGSINFALTGGDPGNGTANWGLNFPNPNPAAQDRQPTSVTLNPHLVSLPDKSTPSNLLNLARAALLVHDESALPPSLDYLHAHMLTWLYLLHPSDCASSLTSCRFQGASAGVGTGAMTVVEQTIYKELGKCVSVARGLGLDLVDRPNGKPKAGGAFAFGRVEEPEEEDEGMGTWEKEMRRRVWWQLMMFDQQISENLGRLPIIPPGTYACKQPSEADESVFGPTATAIPKPPETAKGYNTTYFAAKCQLLTIVKTLSFAQLEEGVTLELARQLDARLSNWRTGLPAQYKIDFREKSEDTLFPDLDTVDVQACDLHVMANVFLLRLWLPFFNEALSSTSQSNHGVLLTATTAANAIIVASHHLVKRFRAARPMSFGYYDFGNSVWIATGILASVVTMKSDVIFSSTARRGVEIAGALFKHQVVQGRDDSVYKPKYEVNKIMGHITRLVEEVPKGKRSTGSKRKSDAGVDQMKMRYGAPIPYVGTAAMTSATNINVPQAQSALRPESNFVSWRSPQHQDSDDMSSASAPPTRARMERSFDPGPPSDSERFHSMDEDFAPAVSVSAVEVPASRPSSVTGQSRMSTSQTSSSQSNKSHGSITVRRRRLQGTNQHAPSTPSTSGVDLPSDSKRSRPPPPSGVNPVGEPSSSNSPHNHSYQLSSSQPEAPVIMAAPNQPSTMQPPQIHQLSAPNPVFHQGRPTQNAQHRHGSSPNVTIGNYHPMQDFSQQPQPGVSPGGYQNPMNPGQQPPASSSYPYYAQMQSRPTGAIIAVDSRSQLTPSQAYGSPASALPQSALPMAHSQANGFLTNLHATGGHHAPHQPESYNPSSGASHMASQDNLGGFDLSGLHAISASQPPAMNEAPQYAGHSQAHQSQHYPMGPIMQETWTNVPAPQSHGAPTHQSQSATAQGWPHSDPSDAPEEPIKKWAKSPVRIASVGQETDFAYKVKLRPIHQIMQSPTVFAPRHQMQLDKTHDVEACPRATEEDSRNTLQRSATLREKINLLANWQIDPSLIEFPEDTREFYGGHATVSRAFLASAFGVRKNAATAKNAEGGQKSRCETLATKTVAVKQLKIASDDQRERERILGLALREAEFLVAISHENVVKLEGLVEDLPNNRIWLIFPWEQHGNLKDFVALRDWEIPERISLIRDVTRGVEYLHYRNPPICHGDLKSINILVTSECNAIITDFGSARRITTKDSDAQITQTEKKAQPVPKFEATYCGTTNAMTLTGNEYTLRWAAPELLMNKGPSLCSDIWALGWIFYEVMTDSVPFQHVQKDYLIIIQVMRGDLPSVTDHARMSLMTRLCSLMIVCWSVDPSERPTAEYCRKLIKWMPAIIPDPQRPSGTAVSRTRSPELLMKLGKMHKQQDNYTHASKFFTEALGIYMGTGDGAGVASALCGLAATYRLQNKYSKAFKLYSQALKIRTEIGDRKGRAKALWGLAEVHRLQNKHSKAISCYSEALEIRTDLGDKEGRAEVLFGLAEVHRLQNECSQAVAFYSEALQIRRDTGNRKERAKALLGLAYVHRIQKEDSKAVTFFSEALQIFTEIGNRKGRAQALLCLADVHRDQNLHSDALCLYEQAAEIFRQIGHTSNAAVATARGAHIRRQLERVKVE